MTSIYWYITKFTPQSIVLNSDFSTGAYTLTALSAGSYDIVPLSGITIGSAGSSAVTSATYTNITLTYVEGTSVTSDIYYQTINQSFSVNETNVASFTPDLSCSFSGWTLINYTISNYESSIAPSWFTIDSILGTVTMKNPSVDSDQEFDFYVNSMNSGLSSPVQKLIKVTIVNWKVDNCKYWSSTSDSIWIACKSGFSLFKNKWISKDAEALAMTTALISGGTITAVAATSLLSTSSMASVWSIVNQIQILYLVFLIGAFIPLDVKAVIGFSQEVKYKFNFPLTNEMLEDIARLKEFIFYKKTILYINKTDYSYF